MNRNVKEQPLIISLISGAHVKAPREREWFTGIYRLK